MNILYSKSQLSFTLCFPQVVSFLRVDDHFREFFRYIVLGKESVSDPKVYECGLKNLRYVLTLTEIEWDWVRLSEIEWDWERLSEIDWHWVRLSEIDWYWLTLTEIEWDWLQLTEIALFHASIIAPSKFWGYPKFRAIILPPTFYALNNFALFISHDSMPKSACKTSGTEQHALNFGCPQLYSLNNCRASLLRGLKLISAGHGTGP